MKKYYFILTIFVVFSSCKRDKEKQPIVTEEKLISEKSLDINITSYSYESLAPLLHKSDDKIYVINFWATWCKPCIEELPAFEKLHSNYKDKNVEVILVSLDFPNQIETMLKPFILDHNLQAKVVLLNDPDQNTWIPEISDTWSGAIPATLIYNKDSREFYEQSFTYNLLINEVTKFIKTNNYENI